MEVYKSPNQFSFITNSDHYYYYYEEDGSWFIERSGDSWDRVSARLDSEKSSWLELLLLTGKGRSWIVRQIRNSERRWRRYLNSVEKDRQEFNQRLERFYQKERSRCKRHQKEKR